MEETEQKIEVSAGQKIETSDRLIILDLAINSIRSPRNEEYKMCICLQGVPKDVPKCDPAMLQTVKQQFYHNLNDKNTRFLELVTDIENGRPVFYAIDQIQYVAIKNIMEV